MTDGKRPALFPVPFLIVEVSLRPTNRRPTNERGRKFMPIYFFRHAEAYQIGEEGIQSDEERFLTPKGRKTTEKVCRGLICMGVTGGRMWYSPLVRARETAEIASVLLGISGSEVKGGLAHLEEDPPLFESLNDQDPNTNLFLVGHQPYLGDWIGRLAAGVTGARIELAKSGVARVDPVPSGATPRGELRWILTAKQLRKLS